MEKKIRLEDMLREIDAEQRKGPEIDLEKIADQAEWEMERQRLLKQKKRSSVVAAAAILVAILVVSFTTLSLDEGYAGHFRQLFARITGSGDQVQVDNFIDGEDKSEYEEVTMNLDEAREKANFDMPLPEYIPEGYLIGKAYVTYFYKDITSVTIIYDNFDSFDKIEYVISPLKYRKAKTEYIDIEESELKALTNNDIEYKYTKNNAKGNFIFWDYDEFLYIVKGNLSEEELIKIVLSIDVKENES